MTSSGNHLAAELALACRLAREAGDAILEVYATQFEVEEKPNDDGPVTVADRRANSLIVDALRRAFPKDGVVAEESAEPDDPSRFERCWSVDPLDGTAEFARRSGEFAVHIGLAVAGEAQLGVVYVPVEDKLHAGVVGAGCTLTQRGATRTLQLPRDVESATIRMFDSRAERTLRLNEAFRLLKAMPAAPCGSVGVRCGRIAEGLTDLYLYFGDGSALWDTCAPEVTLLACGGWFSAADGRPYRYDTPEIENHRGLMGATLPARQRVLERLGF